MSLHIDWSTVPRSFLLTDGGECYLHGVLFAFRANHTNGAWRVGENHGEKLSRRLGATSLKHSGGGVTSPSPPLPFTRKYLLSQMHSFFGFGTIQTRSVEKLENDVPGPLTAIRGTNEFSPKGVTKKCKAKVQTR